MAIKEIRVYLIAYNLIRLLLTAPSAGLSKDGPNPIRS